MFLFFKNSLFLPLMRILLDYSGINNLIVKSL